MDESQIRAALFVWLEKESGRNGGIFTRDQMLGVTRSKRLYVSVRRPEKK